MGNTRLAGDAAGQERHGPTPMAEDQIDVGEILAYAAQEQACYGARGVESILNGRGREIREFDFGRGCDVVNEACCPSAI